MAKFSSQALERWETDSYSADYFEPDIMLPEQFSGQKVAGLDGGERKLMAAILSDGVQSYIEQAISFVRGSGARVDAIDWVENRDTNYIFSFDNVCSSLGISPEYLRVGLARYILKINNKKKTTGSNVRQHSYPVWKRIRRPRKR